MALLYEYLNDRSANVQTFALDALAAFAQRDATVRPHHAYRAQRDRLVEQLHARLAAGAGRAPARRFLCLDGGEPPERGEGDDGDEGEIEPHGIVMESTA